MQSVLLSWYVSYQLTLSHNPYCRSLILENPVVRSLPSFKNETIDGFAPSWPGKVWKKEEISGATHEKGLYPVTLCMLGKTPYAESVAPDQSAHLHNLIWVPWHMLHIASKELRAQTCKLVNTGPFFQKLGRGLSLSFWEIQACFMVKLGKGWLTFIEDILTKNVDLSSLFVKYTSGESYIWRKLGCSTS